MGLFKKHTDPEVLYQQGEAFYDKEDYSKAVSFYKKAAELGHAEAQYSLGFCYDKGRGVAVDAKQAVYWYTCAANAKHPHALYLLGYCYYDGKGVSVDCEKAKYCWNLAACLGDNDARENVEINKYYEGNEIELARKLLNGTDNITKDVGKALEIIKKGIRFGDGTAYFLLGYITISGAEPYVKKDIDEGLQLLYKGAVKRGDPLDAMEFIDALRTGSLYDVQIPKSDEMAGHYAVKIAEEIRSNSEDGFFIAPGVFSAAAWAYINGYGVRKDYEKARQWIEFIRSVDRNGFFMNGWAGTLDKELRSYGY